MKPNWKKRNNRITAAAVCLALCVLLSGSILFSRMMAYTPADTQHYIPLTTGNGVTTVVTGQRDAAGAIRFCAPPRPGRPVVLAASPFLTGSWFEVHDKNTVWKGQTDIEIFRLSYRNGSGEITVKSGNGEKVIAPGTENTYSFTLENTGNQPLEYEMTMEAYFSDGDTVIPVLARVSDDLDKKWLCGSVLGYEPVLELNDVSDSGTLRAGYVQPYTLTWQWPFEGDDAYDTMLGNLAQDEDLTLTIVINTLASYTPVDDGGIPKTGDMSHIGMAFGVMVTSLAALLLLLLIPRRRREEENA